MVRPKSLKVPDIANEKYITFPNIDEYDWRERKTNVHT